MDAYTLLQTIDIWCQWDSTFGEHADELRLYFTSHPKTFQAILLHMLTSRGRQPTKKWIYNWTELKTTVPASLLRHLLLGLAVKRTWYKGIANEAETRMLVAYERGQPISPDASYEYGTITIYETRAYASSGVKTWYKQGTTWYECFSGKEAQRLYKIAYGACWALVAFPDVQVRDLLTFLIRVKHRQTVIWTIAQWADEDAVACLLHIQQRTKHRGVLSRIENVLPEIANQRGMTVEELKDRAIFMHDLNEQGERTWHVGGFTLHLTISPAGRMLRRIRGSDGKVLRRHPDALAETWRLMSEEAKMLSMTLSIQRKRLEAAMRERRSWSCAEWQCTFAAHLISRRLARRLVWKISSPDESHSAYAFLDEQGGWHNAEGEAVVISSEYRFRIAHPVEMTPEEHSRWQRYLVTHKITQPFKQMFRETYVLTPAEEQTRTYSNRFSTYVIPSHAMQASERRGWESQWSGCWRDFQRDNIRAYLWIESNHRDAYNILQQIAFYPLDHSTVYSQPRLDLDPACLPLQDIPAVVFSETLRDIDQCLVRASQGTNQQWETENKSQSNYAQQAQLRESLLRELLPLLDLGPTVQIEGRLAYIDGKRSSYKIDLTNGTIYTEPGGRYLCIVPRYNTQKLYLPFEENDPKTAEILSKILLLVHDEAITDATILRQLPVKAVQLR